MRSIKLSSTLVLIVLVGALAASGCQTEAQTDALVGGGIGAVAGQAIGGDTEATLIGAGIGAGVGYLIGNSQDKKKAEQMSQAQPADNPTHDEVGELGGTRWRVISVTPAEAIKEEYTSKVVEFKADGRVHTVTTRPDGSVKTADETYRVVGDTLIVNMPGYLINAKFAVSGDQLTVSANEFSAVLERL